MNNEDVFQGLGVRIRFQDPESFLKIKETLTRIGVASKKDKKLYQSCHILHKRGQYAILHFKELFILDGKTNTLVDEDVARRNTIVNLLEEWKLLEIIDTTRVEDPVAPLSQIKVLSHREKSEWSLEAKYMIGKKKVT
jgi:hypothetical protein